MVARVLVFDAVRVLFSRWEEFMIEPVAFVRSAELFSMVLELDILSRNVELIKDELSMSVLLAWE